MAAIKLFVLSLLIIGSINVHSMESLQSKLQKVSKTSQPVLSNANNTQRVITYQLAYNLMVIKAYVNGQYGNFIVDTGAETLILNEKYFSGRENNKNYAVDFNGSKVKYQEANVQFGWGLEEEETKFAIITDMSLIEKIMKAPILGNIGFNVLKDYEITFDNSKRTIMLVKLDRKGNYINVVPSNYTTIDIIELKANGCKPYIIAHSKGEKLKLSIDTGAASSVLSNRAAKKLKKEFQWKENIKSSAYNGKIYESKNGILPILNIKTNFWYSIKVIVADKWNTSSDNRKKLDGLLGNDFLHKRIVGINFTKGEMYLLENKIETKQEVELLAQN